MVVLICPRHRDSKSPGHEATAPCYHPTVLSAVLRPSMWVSKLPVKGQIVNISHSVGHMVSVVTAQAAMEAPTWPRTVHKQVNMAVFQRNVSHCHKILFRYSPSDLFNHLKM